MEERLEKLIIFFSYWEVGEISGFYMGIYPVLCGDHSLEINKILVKYLRFVVKSIRITVVDTVLQVGQKAQFFNNCTF